MGKWMDRLMKDGCTEGRTDWGKTNKEKVVWVIRQMNK